MIAVPDLIATITFFLVLTGKLILLFVVISFLIGLLQEFITPETIQKKLSSKPKWLVNILGAGLGSLTPFCSCSTIPILTGLLKGGIPFGASMSFLLASPLLNPVIIGLFMVLLGFKVTALYFIITFTAAVVSGFVWEKLGLSNQLKNTMVPATACCQAQACNTLDLVDLSQEPELKDKIKNSALSAWALFRQVFPYLVLGSAMGAAIYGFVPEEQVLKFAGANNPLAVPVAAIIGIPMYIRAETIIPISSVLLDKGMSLGAVIALVIGGAGASIPEVAILASIFKRRLVIAFVVTVLTVAVLTGLFFNLIFS